MISTVLRKTAMVMALPAVVAASSASPAMATSYGGHHEDDESVHIKVCKVVNDHDHKDYTYGDHDTKFTIHVKTDKDYASVRVRDGRCERVELDYDKPKFKVWEDDAKGYEFKYIKCSDGAYKRSDDRCKFDSDDNYVKVTVYNEKDHKHHGGDDD
jgi:hypothetical protein